MNNAHDNILRALVAAQVALLEHMDESFDDHRAKPLLIECLNRALREAKKLDQ